MAAMIKSVYRGYIHVFHEHADPRVTDWFLIGSPLYPLGIITLYLYLVKTAGPWFMKDRPAYKLTGIIALYNVTQIVLNAALFIKAAKIMMTQDSFCAATDYPYSPDGMYVAGSAWEYLMLKVLDLLDTIFFVLRKKNNQVSALHLYHHVITVLTSWTVIRIAASGHFALLGCMNTFVHVFMYSYYFVTNFWPQYTKNIWWKKYITQLQMTQFGINFLYFLAASIVPNCQFLVRISIFAALQSLIMFVMFYDFYRKTYRKQKTV